MNSPATNQPWPVGWHCTLAATNRDGVKANDYDLRQRCSLLSCPACSSFDVRKRVQGMIRAANEWRLCRLAPTIPLGPIDVALFGPRDVEAVFQLADALAARLQASGEVVGFLLKVEFAPGRKGTSNAAQVVLPHIHAELLSRSPLTRADVERIVGRQLPGLHLQPCDSGWTRYLGKSVVSDGDNWNPAARRSVVDALDKWQRTKQRYSRSKRKRGKRCHAYRFGGLAHGNGFRWARNAMERCAEIEKLTGHAKQAALNVAQRSVSFKKWSDLWSLWRGPEKYSGRFTQLDHSKLRVPALPAVVVVGKIGGARRAKRADARSPCLPAPFANCLRGALKRSGRSVLRLVTVVQTADCLLKGGQAGAASTHYAAYRIRGPPSFREGGSANVCTDSETRGVVMGKWIDLIGEDRSKIVEDLRQQFSEHPPGPTDLDAEMLLLSIRGFSYADIASVCRTSRTTVHKRVNRGRRNAAKLLLSRRHSRAVIDVLLTLEYLLAEAVEAVEHAATGSADKWRALDRAASIAMRRYDVYADLGLIRRQQNEYQKIADRIEKLNLNQLEAERERLMRKIADAPKRSAENGKHNT